MKKNIPIVAFLTDFGTRDYYAAAMKAVILNSVPQARFVDITHEIPPQDVRSGCFQLYSCFQDFPKGTFFICVVDPGVGSRRKILFAEGRGYKFIGPDNGLLSWAFEEVKPKRIWAISKVGSLGPVSKTFHGRDIMAPVAGRILNGESPSKFGVPVNRWQKFPCPIARKTGSKWVGEILAADRFGNLITNFKAKDLNSFKKEAKLWFNLGRGRRTIRGLEESYSSVAKGKLLAIVGSSGFVEISVRDGNAALKTRLKPGDKVELLIRI